MNAGPLFPRRDFAGRRLVVSLLRALHLAGVVGVGAVLLGAGDIVAASAFAFMLVAGGLGIMALDRWSDPAYLRQVNGLAMLAKLVLLAALVWFVGMSLTLFWSVFLFSVLVAHAPASIRHRKLF
jgi:hypothetical protein